MRRASCRLWTRREGPCLPRAAAGVARTGVTPARPLPGQPRGGAWRPGPSHGAAAGGEGGAAACGSPCLWRLGLCGVTPALSSRRCWPSQLGPLRTRGQVGGRPHLPPGERRGPEAGGVPSLPVRGERPLLQRRPAAGLAPRRVPGPSVKLGLRPPAPHLPALPRVSFPHAVACGPGGGRQGPGLPSPLSGAGPAHAPDGWPPALSLPGRALLTTQGRGHPGRPTESGSGLHLRGRRAWAPAGPVGTVGPQPGERPCGRAGRLEDSWGQKPLSASLLGGGWAPLGTATRRCPPGGRGLAWERPGRGAGCGSRDGPCAL